MALPTLRRSGIPVRVRRDEERVPTGTLARIDPWSDFNLMGRLFEPFFPTPWNALGQGLQGTTAIEPSVELYETTNDLIAYVYLPGITQNTLEIMTTSDAFTVKGERKPFLEVSDDLMALTPYSSATTTGTFDITYSLPVEVNPDVVQAIYKDGILELRMPKSEAAKPKKVKVDIHHG